MKTRFKKIITIFISTLYFMGLFLGLISVEANATETPSLYQKKISLPSGISTVYKNEIGDANMLAKNVADIKVDGGTIIFTDLMGIRYTFNGTLEKVDLMDNYVLVKEA